MKLQNKVVVITGAASGMGLAMTHLFLDEGASVICGDWNQTRLNSLVDELTALGKPIVGKWGNIAIRSEAEALIEIAIKQFGKIDVLVNNAGVMDHLGGVDEIDDQTWNRVLGVNLNGPMYATRKAIQAMLELGTGSIINIASTAAFHGAVAGVAYTTSKHALLGFTKNTAWMYAQKGIRSNAICPGATSTNIQETMPENLISSLGRERLIPCHKLAPAQLEAVDIAKLALFFASDESRMINGAIVAADGGWGVI